MRGRTPNRAVDDRVMSGLGARDPIVEQLVAGPVVGVSAPAIPTCDRLYPEERAYIRKAVESRRAEFGTARVIAREALAALGVPVQALVPEGTREPRWPSGIVGSISHSHGACAVVVGRATDVRSMGIDVERRRPLNPDLLSQVLTPDEIRKDSARPPMQRSMHGLIRFSAKEAVFKCQYPLTGRFVAPTDVEIVLSESEGSYRVDVAPGSRSCPSLEAVIRAIDGRYRVGSSYVMTGATSVAHDSATRERPRAPTAWRDECSAAAGRRHALW